MGPSFKQLHTPMFGLPPQESDIVDELTSGRYGMFRVLVEAVVAANFVDNLKDMKEFTVLCPTNLAFQRAGLCDTSGHLNFKGEESILQNILNCHIIPRRLEHLPETGSLSTLNGEVLLDTDYDEKLKYPLRTRVTLASSADKSACVLLQMFESSNANFAAIGRVLVPPEPVFGSRTVHFHDGNIVHFP